MSKINNVGLNLGHKIANPFKTSRNITTPNPFKYSDFEGNSLPYADVFGGVEKKNVNMHDAMWFWVVPKRDENGTVVDVCFESEDRRYATRDLAFDHINIVIDALNRIQNKVEYTDIAFNLLPSQFTVKELEMVYQCIVGHKIQGFRRKMGDKIITTQIMKDDGSAHRPAEYYQYNKNHTQKF